MVVAAVIFGISIFERDVARGLAFVNPKIARKGAKPSMSSLMMAAYLSGHIPMFGCA